MSWITRDENVETQEEMGGVSGVKVTDAYKATIKEAYVKDSTVEGSQSMSIVISAETTDGELVKTYYTIQGKNGKGYYERDGKRFQHIGTGIVKTVFKILLDKEIYDVEPVDGTYKGWDNDTKKQIDVNGRVFADVIGKEIGICVQMIRKIAGTDTKEYGEIAHFFDIETGLFAGEVDSGKKRKIDKWLDGRKEYKIIEEKQVSSSFGKKAEASADTGRSKWGS